MWKDFETTTSSCTAREYAHPRRTWHLSSERRGNLLRKPNGATDHFCFRGFFLFLFLINFFFVSFSFNFFFFHFDVFLPILVFASYFCFFFYFLFIGKKKISIKSQKIKSKETKSENNAKKEGQWPLWDSLIDDPLNKKTTTTTAGSNKQTKLHTNQEIVLQRNN